MSWCRCPGLDLSRHERLPCNADQLWSYQLGKSLQSSLIKQIKISDASCSRVSSVGEMLNDVRLVAELPEFCTGELTQKHQI